MADLRVVSTGKEFRRIDNGVAHLLEEMFPNALERINAPESPITAPRHIIPQLAPSTTVKWNVGQTPRGDYFIRATDNRQELLYLGAPEKAHEWQAWLCGGGHTPPIEIIKQYARCRNLPDSEAVMERARIAIDEYESKQRR
jgi:hypothetical protein